MSRPALLAALLATALVAALATAQAQAPEAGMPPLATPPAEGLYPDLPYQPAPPPTDAVVTAFHFGCLQDWEQVGHTRYFNMLGHLDETLAVANNPDGGVFPVGTIAQLMPTEAMVKRAPGTFPETDDWEYLKLKVDKTGQVEITERGGAEVRNLAGSCAECHTTEPQFDHVCAQGHGCKDLPGFIVKAALKAVDKDPRCGP